MVKINAPSLRLGSIQKRKGGALISLPILNAPGFPSSIFSQIEKLAPVYAWVWSR